MFSTDPWISTFYQHTVILPILKTARKKTKRDLFKSETVSASLVAVMVIRNNSELTELVSADKTLLECLQRFVSNGMVLHRFVI